MLSDLSVWRFFSPFLTANPSILQGDFGGYPLVICCNLLLNMVIEIVNLPIKWQYHEHVIEHGHCNLLQFEHYHFTFTY